MKVITFTSRERHTTALDALDLTFDTTLTREMHGRTFKIESVDAQILEALPIAAGETRYRYVTKTVWSDDQQPVRKARQRRAPAASAVESAAGPDAAEPAAADVDPEPSSSDEASLTNPSE